MKFVVGLSLAAAAAASASLPPPKTALAAALSDLRSQLGPRAALPLRTREWDARSPSRTASEATAPREIKTAVYLEGLDGGGIRASGRALKAEAEDRSVGKTDMDILMGDLGLEDGDGDGDGDGDEPDAIVPDADADQALLDEFDMEIQEEEILANEEASKAGGEDEYDMAVQEQEITDSAVQKDILENEAAIDSAEVDEIKEEESLLEEEVNESKIEPGLAEGEMAKLQDSLEKAEKAEEEAMAKLEEAESRWGHEVEIVVDDLDTEENETYLSIKKLENKTIGHRCIVSKVMNGTDVVPVVLCDFLIPIGLPAKAEILDGHCTAFTDEANSTYFTDGVATAVHVPTLTDDEKRAGIFDHTYCARLDFVYGGKSVVEKRYLMEITYHYLVDKRTGEVQGLLGADVHDEASGIEERNKAVAIGLGVFGGVIVTLALVAMIFGKKRRQRREVAEGRELYSSRGEDLELVNTPSVEAVNEAFQAGESLGGGDAGGADVSDGDYEALAAVGEAERREREENELV